VYKNWQCFPRAVAHSLGVSLDQIIDLAGHDGGEIINPQLKDPWARRGFHPQEITDIVSRLGYAMVAIEYDPKIVPIKDCIRKSIYTHDQNVKRFEYFLHYTYGVLAAHRNITGHVWAYDHDVLIDPNKENNKLTLQDLCIQDQWIPSCLWYFVDGTGETGEGILPLGDWKFFKQ